MRTPSRAAPLVAASTARSPLRIVRASALAGAPWKNGGGMTREIAAYPVGASLDTFIWRVSVADVDESGPFSRFPGIDRTLVLLGGAGMRLIEADGETHLLAQPLSVARFDGDAPVRAQLVDSATRDFNLMVRRGRADATLQVWREAGRHVLDADVALVFCARGALDVRVGPPSQGLADEAQAQATLTAMDTLVLDAPRALACEVAGDGAALAVLVRYT